MSDFNPLKLTGKTFLITGAGSGIGKATALLLSKLDADLILLDINAENLTQTLQECKSTDFIKVVDITDSDVLKVAIIEGIEKLGKLDGVAHIAGIPCIAPLKVVSKQMCEKVLNINTLPALELAQIFSNRKIHKDNGGSIVLISSVYANVGSSANVVYAMSKTAIHGITKSLAIELADKKIRVNCIAPGFVKTQMSKDINHLFDAEHNDLLEKLHPLGLGEAEDVANMIAFLLSDASRWCTGGIFNVDGGFTAQ